MISVYLNVLLMTIIFTAPTVVFSHNDNEIIPNHVIEKKCKYLLKILKKFKYFQHYFVDKYVS